MKKQKSIKTQRSKVVKSNPISVVKRHNCRGFSSVGIDWYVCVKGVLGFGKEVLELHADAQVEMALVVAGKRLAASG